MTTTWSSADAAATTAASRSDEAAAASRRRRTGWGGRGGGESRQVSSGGSDADVERSGHRGLARAIGGGAESAPEEEGRTSRADGRRGARDAAGATRPEVDGDAARVITRKVRSKKRGERDDDGATWNRPLSVTPRRGNGHGGLLRRSSTS